MGRTRKRVTEKGRGTRHAIKQKGPEKWNWADVESGLERARQVEGSNGLHNADGRAFVITHYSVNKSKDICTGIPSIAR